MPLIVEDGSKPLRANSYCSVTDCDAWQAERGLLTWPAPPESGDDSRLADKEAALIKAADYLNGLNWKGRRAAAGRLMAWPRLEVVDGDGYAVAEDEVPEAVPAAACYLAALVIGGTDLQPVLARGGRVASEAVDSLSSSYFDDAASRDVHSTLADLLSGLAHDFKGYSGTALTAGQSGSIRKVTRA